MVRSKDNGLTWDNGTVIFDTILDDRDAGLTTLRNGTIVGHFWSTHSTKKNYLNLLEEVRGKKNLKPLLEFL